MLDVDNDLLFGGLLDMLVLVSMLEEVVLGNDVLDQEVVLVVSVYGKMVDVAMVWVVVTARNSTISKSTVHGVV